ncbi:MAG: hypothetical protein WDZ76_09395 [Pseudohongiellaceae bacterium]
MRSNKFLIMGLLAGSLPACSNHYPSIHEDFGAAVTHNIAVQTINPDAAGPDESASIDGQQAAQAVDRYREGPTEVDNTSLIQDVGDN